MTERKKRRHVAKGARVAAAGLGASTMLGLVGAMGYYKQDSASAAALPTTAQQNPVMVVIHHHGSPDTVVTSVPALLGQAPMAATSELALPAPTPKTIEPTVLRARPTVSPSTARSQTPAASTSGSR